MNKPSVFIGSSTVGLQVAGLIRSQLSEVAEVERWDEPSVFPLGVGTLESLMRAVDRFDFAVFLFTPDYLLAGASGHSKSARDNILFEMGLFMGRLGRERTFLVCCKDDEAKIPSDLAGITFATYSRPGDENQLAAALEPACSRIQRSIETQGKAADWQRLNREVKEQDSAIRTMQMEIDAIRMALEGSITQFEYDKLEGLDRSGPFMCWFHDNLRPEMRRLFAHGYVAETGFGSGRSLEQHRHSGKQFDLKAHFVLTDKGRAYLKLRRDWQGRSKAAAG